MNFILILMKTNILMKMMKLLNKKKIYENDSDHQSFISNDSNERNIEKVHNYYVNNSYKDNDNNSYKDIDNIINQNNEKYVKEYVEQEYVVQTYDQNVQVYDQKNNTKQVNNEIKYNKNDFSCHLCKNNSNKDNYFILSCDHIYHIQCLADTHFQDIYNYPVIDSEYLSKRKCNVCLKQMQLEEVMYLHGKYLSNTKDSIEKHQTSIENLEYQLKKIKDELRICYDYKHKLEQQREKSKQIVSILSTMIYN